MELRHLRYFIAVAEAGSLTVAAQRKLHTTQPSLSRQIRDLEEEVGAQLLTRSARGIELTPAREGDISIIWEGHFAGSTGPLLPDRKIGKPGASSGDRILGRELTSKGP
jgi:Bacterial regulatory helix-turn-helix protein, lysR family